jgi:hypothetical protein
VLKRYWEQWDSIDLKDGLLYRKFFCVSETKSRMQILAPPDKQNLILEACHDAVTAGHMGRRRTPYNVRLRFFWPGWRRAVECATRGNRTPVLHNGHPHDTLGLTPNEVMLGRQASKPVDIQIGSTPGEVVELPEYVNDFKGYRMPMNVNRPI